MSAQSSLHPQSARAIRLRAQRVLFVVSAGSSLTHRSTRTQMLRKLMGGLGGDVDRCQPGRDHRRGWLPDLGVLGSRGHGRVLLRAGWGADQHQCRKLHER